MNLRSGKIIRRTIKISLENQEENMGAAISMKKEESKARDNVMLQSSPSTSHSSLTSTQFDSPLHSQQRTNQETQFAPPLHSQQCANQETRFDSSLQSQQRANQETQFASSVFNNAANRGNQTWESKWRTAAENSTRKSKWGRAARISRAFVRGFIRAMWFIFVLLTVAMCWTGGVYTIYPIYNDINKIETVVEEQPIMNGDTVQVIIMKKPGISIK